jgi:hypothetical protein
MGLMMSRLFICLLLVGIVGCGESNSGGKTDDTNGNQRISDGAWLTKVPADREGKVFADIIFELDGTGGRASVPNAPSGSSGDGVYIQIIDVVLVGNKVTFVVLNTENEPCFSVEAIYKQGQFVGTFKSLITPSYGEHACTLTRVIDK